MTDPPARPEPPASDEPAFFAEALRFTLIPAAIVALCVVVFLLFGQIASERRSAREYVQEVRHGASNRRWQAAFELSRILTKDERARADAGLLGEITAILGDPKTDDPLVRRYLLLALEEMGDPAAAPAVEAALHDADPEVRLYAARALGRLAAPSSTAALAPLLEDEDPALRKMALHSLGRLGDRGMAERMRPRLEDPVEDVRWNAALGLAVLGDASGAGILRQMMDVEHLGRVPEITEAQMLEARVNAVQAAWRLRDPDLRTVVEDLSRKDPSLVVRDVALRALKEWP